MTSRHTRCDRIAETIADILFEAIANTSGSSCQLTLEDVLSIINEISTQPRYTVAPMKTWRSIIAAVFFVPSHFPLLIGS